MENTIINLYGGDHGWHLGESACLGENIHYMKTSLKARTLYKSSPSVTQGLKVTGLLSKVANHVLSVSG